MVVEGKGEVSACGHRSEEIGIGDLGFRGDVTGASGSEEEIGNYTDGEEVDIMVGFLGTNVVFDGVYGTEGLEDSREEDFRNLERQIEETLEIKDEEDYDKEPGGDKSDAIVSCVRALVKSLPLPGQISPEELLEINPQAFAHKHNSEEMFDVVDQVKPSLKRKNESEDVKHEECGSRYAWSSMSKRYQEFEDFLISSTKYVPSDKMTSQPRVLEVPVEDHNTNSQKGLPGKSEMESSRPNSCDESNLPCPIKDIKDSYWTDMVIETSSPVKLPGTVDTMSDSQMLNTQSTRLGAEGPSNGLRKKNVNDGRVPLVATSDKYSPAELILTFDDTQAIPSKSKLNNIFKRFGTLRETETVIYQESSRARVVFKRSSDAEVAVSSAKAFSILGSSVISYELGLSPLSYNAMPGLKVDNTKVVVQITHPELTTDLRNDPEDVPAQQMHFEDVAFEADIALETEVCAGLDDVDIMT